ncbi:MAG TPA: HAD family phosphatase [Sedimentisphaerales bacterium]|nr:HAD family phosphatase [Sedimentisphaerales bacterium]
MLRAVIFDFDGVITDSEILHFRAFNQVLAQYGIELTKDDYYKTYLGFNDADCYKLLISQGLLKTDKQQIKNLIEQKKRIFEQLAKAEGKMIEGVRDFLNMLEQNNIPMAICSGALLTEVEMVLEDARLRHLFEAIVSGEQVKKGKPDPEGFLLSLQRLNENRENPITANQCIVIEDSHWGLEAAKAAGMHTIAVTNSYDAEQLSMADKIVERLNELSIDDLQQLCICLNS